MKRDTAPRFSEEDTRPVETSGWQDLHTIAPNKDCRGTLIKRPGPTPC
jgi:hypothetical protein